MRISLLCVAAATVVTFTPASAQRASQHGVVSQTVNETEIRLEYDRPVARGRELFGELIEWEALWTPGANRATWIEFSERVTINGHEMPKGRYAMWMVPQEDRPWEVVFVSEWDTHHGAGARSACRHGRRQIDRRGCHGWHRGPRDTDARRRNEPLCTEQCSNSLN